MWLFYTIWLPHAFSWALGNEIQWHSSRVHFQLLCVRKTWLGCRVCVDRINFVQIALNHALHDCRGLRSMLHDKNATPRHLSNIWNVTLDVADSV
jgi:hypothetical protein